MDLNCSPPAGPPLIQAMTAASEDRPDRGGIQFANIHYEIIANKSQRKRLFDCILKNLPRNLKERAAIQSHKMYMFAR